MCIIVYQPTDQIVTKETLRECWESNSDGAGYMWAADGRVHVRKGFFKFKRLWSSYRNDLHQNRGSNFVIHFRIATSGNIDEPNCHPHRVTSRLAVAHNGILPIRVPKGSHKSDTALFCDRVLSHLPKGWQRNPAISFLVEEYLGLGNKIAVLEGCGDVTILNEDLGIWENGCWYSNRSYQTVPKLSKVATKYATRTTAAGKPWWDEELARWEDDNAPNSAAILTMPTREYSDAYRCDICDAQVPVGEGLAHEDCILCEDCWATCQHGMH